MDPYWKHQEASDPRHDIDRAASAVHNTLPSLTQQHFAKDADLNTIAKRYGITDGAIPPAALDPQYFGDYTDTADFREHLDRIRNATDRFNMLPADLRAQFGNSMINLHNWVMDPNNAEEAVTYGLLQKRSKTPPPTPKRDDTTTKEVRPPAPVPPVVNPV